MKRVAELLIIALAALCLSSCGKSFKDIKVTSCDVVSVSPKGLTSFDAELNLGVDNPASQITLSQMNATVKMDGSPCLYLTADDVTVAPRTEQNYSLLLHGLMDSNFNPFTLLSLIKQPDLSSMTVDVRFHGALKSGIGKDFEYNDIPLKNLLGNL
jgi:LEA14-like dessication related protein